MPERTMKRRSESSVCTGSWSESMKEVISVMLVMLAGVGKGDAYPPGVGGEVADGIVYES